MSVFFSFFNRRYSFAWPSELISFISTLTFLSLLLPVGLTKCINIRTDLTLFRKEIQAWANTASSLHLLQCSVSLTLEDKNKLLFLLSPALPPLMGRQLCRPLRQELGHIIAPLSASKALGKVRLCVL